MSRHLSVKKQGLSVIEMVIVVAALSLLATLTFSSFSGLNKSQILEKEALSVLSVMQEARSLTLASKDASRYGVHFGENTITIFTGEVYNPTDPANKITPLHQEIENIPVTLNGGGLDVVFDRLTGGTNQFGTTTLRLKNDPGKIKNIVIFATGVAEIK